MTLITFQDGKVVMRDGQVGTEQACCCNCCTCADKQGVLDELRFDFAGLAEDGRTGGDGGTAIPEGGFDFLTPPQFGSAGSYWVEGDVVDGVLYQNFRVLWDGEINAEDCTFAVSLEVECVNRECADAYADCVFDRDESGACVCTNHPEINACIDPAECLYICTQVATYTWTFKLACEGDQLAVHDVNDGTPTVSLMFPDGFATCDVDCNAPPKPQFTVTSSGALSCRCCDEPPNPLP